MSDTLKVNCTLINLDLEFNSVGKEDMNSESIGNREIFEKLEESRKGLIGFAKEYSKKLSTFANCHYNYQ